MFKDLWELKILHFFIRRLSIYFHASSLQPFKENILLFENNRKSIFFHFGTIWSFLDPDSDLDSESVFLAPLIHRHYFIFAAAKQLVLDTKQSGSTRTFKYCLMLSFILNREAVNRIYFSVCSFSPTHKHFAGTRTICTWSTESSTMCPGSFRKPSRRIQRLTIFAFTPLIKVRNVGIVPEPKPACLKITILDFSFLVGITVMGLH